MEPLGLGLIGYGGFGRFCLDVHAACRSRALGSLLHMSLEKLAIATRAAWWLPTTTPGEE